MSLGAIDVSQALNFVTHLDGIKEAVSPPSVRQKISNIHWTFYVMISAGTAAIIGTIAAAILANVAITIPAAVVAGCFALGAWSIYHLSPIYETDQQIRLLAKGVFFMRDTLETAKKIESNETEEIAEWKKQIEEYRKNIQKSFLQIGEREKMCNDIIGKMSNLLKKMTVISNEGKSELEELKQLLDLQVIEEEKRKEATLNIQENTNRIQDFILKLNTGIDRLLSVEKDLSDEASKLSHTDEAMKSTLTSYQDNVAKAANIAERMNALRPKETSPVSPPPGRGLLAIFNRRKA